MRKKIYQVGPATLVISLPSKWVKKNNLKKGDEVEIEENPDSIMLSLISKLHGNKAITLDIDSSSQFLKRFVTRNYILGYDEIRIRFKDNLALEKIEDAVNQLIGFEIVDLAEKSCVIKNISGEISEEFDTILKRLLLIIIMMGERCLNFKERIELEKNIETEKVTNRYCYFCERVLHKNIFDDDKRLFSVIFTLEQVADRFLDITHQLLKAKSEPSKESIQYLKEINELFRQYNENFYAKDIKKQIIIRNKQFKVKNQIIEDISSNGLNDPILFHQSALLVFIEHLNQITI